VKALSGTGMESVGLPVLEPPPEPPPEPDEALTAGRVVPLREVFALEEMPVEVLVLDKTVLLELVVEAGDSAELDLTVDAFNAVLCFAEASAEVEDAGDDETPVTEVGDSSAVPDDAEPPAPAPEDDPAVFEAMAAGAVLIEED
jgi:hypothetical protein